LAGCLKLGLITQPSVSQGATVVYTDSATFLANVSGPTLFTNFNSLNGVGVTPNFSYSGNGFTVNAATFPPPNDFFHGVGFVSLNIATNSIVLTFSGNPVTAIGGNLFPSGISGSFSAGSIQVVLSDGTTNVVAASSVNAYRGFTSDTPFTSMVISSIQPVPTTFFLWPSLDNLTVGTALVVPEPVSVASLGAVGALMLGRRRRRSA
jgi:multidrug transporter EmrE-like cation transporter